MPVMLQRLETMSLMEFTPPSTEEEKRGRHTTGKWNQPTSCSFIGWLTVLLLITPVLVLHCETECVPVIDFRPVQGVPHPPPSDSWIYTPALPLDPKRNKWVKKTGFECFVTFSLVGELTLMMYILKVTLLSCLTYMSCHSWCRGKTEWTKTFAKTFSRSANM